MKILLIFFFFLSFHQISSQCLLPTSTNLCRQCLPSHYSTELTTNQKTEVPISSCKQKTLHENPTFFINNVYCSAPPCNGRSLNTAYPNMTVALAEINKFSTIPSYTYITIYVLGTLHSIFHDENFPRGMRLFRQTVASVQFKPAYCSLISNFANCVPDGNKPTLLFRTSEVYFFISFRLQFIDFVFSAADTQLSPPLVWPLSSSQLGFVCDNEATGCCSTASLFQKIGSSGSSRCGLQGIALVQSTSSANGYGIFNIEHQMLGQPQQISLLSFKNCVFNLMNFFSPTGAQSLVTLNDGHGYLSLESVTIANSFFPNGILNMVFDTVDPIFGVQLSKLYYYTVQGQNYLVDSSKNITLYETKISGYNPFSIYIGKSSHYHSLFFLKNLAIRQFFKSNFISLRTQFLNTANQLSTQALHLFYFENSINCFVNDTILSNLKNVSLGLQFYSIVSYNNFAASQLAISASAYYTFFYIFQSQTNFYNANFTICSFGNFFFQTKQSVLTYEKGLFSNIATMKTMFYFRDTQNSAVNENGKTIEKLLGLNTVTLNDVTFLQITASEKVNFLETANSTIDILNSKFYYLNCYIAFYLNDAKTTFTSPVFANSQASIYLLSKGNVEISKAIANSVVAFDFLLLFPEADFKINTLQLQYCKLSNGIITVRSDKIKLSAEVITIITCHSSFFINFQTESISEHSDLVVKNLTVATSSFFKECIVVRKAKFEGFAFVFQQNNFNSSLLVLQELSQFKLDYLTFYQNTIYNNETNRVIYLISAEKCQKISFSKVVVYQLILNILQNTLALFNLQQNKDLMLIKTSISFIQGKLIILFSEKNQKIILNEITINSVNVVNSNLESLILLGANLNIFTGPSSLAFKPSVYFDIEINKLHFNKVSAENQTFLLLNDAANVKINDFVLNEIIAAKQFFWANNIMNLEVQKFYIQNFGITKGIFVQGSRVSIKDSRFSGISIKNGGSLISIDGYSWFGLDSCIFFDFTLGESSQLINSYNSKLLILNSAIQNIYLPSTGTLINCFGNSPQNSLNISNNTFQNISKGNIILSSFSNELILNELSFELCETKSFYSFFYLDQPNNLKISSIKFKNSISSYSFIFIGSQFHINSNAVISKIELSNTKTYENYLFYFVNHLYYEIYDMKINDHEGGILFATGTKGIGEAGTSSKLTKLVADKINTTKISIININGEKIICDNIDINNVFGGGSRLIDIDSSSFQLISQTSGIETVFYIDSSNSVIKSIEIDLSLNNQTLFSIIKSDFTLESSTINNYNGNNLRYILFLQDSIIKLKNLNFTNNVGTLFFGNGISLEILKAKFNGNQQGAIFNLFRFTKIALIESDFISNLASIFFQLEKIG